MSQTECIIKSIYIHIIKSRQGFSNILHLHTVTYGVVGGGSRVDVNKQAVKSCRVSHFHQPAGEWAFDASDNFQFKASDICSQWRLLHSCSGNCWDMFKWLSLYGSPIVIVFFCRSSFVLSLSFNWIIMLKLFLFVRWTREAVLLSLLLQASLLKLLHVEWMYNMYIFWKLVERQCWLTASGQLLEFHGHRLAGSIDVVEATF